MFLQPWKLVKQYPGDHRFTTNNVGSSVKRRGPYTDIYGQRTKHTTVWKISVIKWHITHIDWLSFLRLLFQLHCLCSVERFISDEMERVQKEASEAFWGTIPAFAFRDYRKPRRTSVRVACLWTEFQTRGLQNIKQECQPLDCDVMFLLQSISQKLYNQFTVVHCFICLLGQWRDIEQVNVFI
jgi:hypothetical protein